MGGARYVVVGGGCCVALEDQEEEEGQKGIKEGLARGGKGVTSGLNR
jgi:hypothetical protein